jgi:hypothetical protein
MLSRRMAVSAVSKLQQFHADLKNFYESHNIDFLEDTGRRNILMSRPQEKFFAHELSTKYPGASADGRTGEPDIIIPTLDKELECKITSPHRSGAWSLQTDYNTLLQKSSLDYLYVLCDRDFENFAVFHFENLTSEDFKEPASGSRGKSPLIMRNAIRKCNILMGDIENRKAKFLSEIEEELKYADEATKKYTKLLKRQKYWLNNLESFSFKLENLKEALD